MCKLFDFSLAEIRYTKDHYWVERIKTTDEYKVGLSDYAQDSYGDFVVVEIERMNEIVDKDGKSRGFNLDGWKSMKVMLYLLFQQCHFTTI